MNQGRRVKKIFESKPEESRIRRRPRLRLLEQEDEGLRGIKCERWPQNAVNRERA
jgi:hypothetical protein